MVEKRFVIEDENGFHARPAGQLAEIANDFECDVTLIKLKDNSEVNAKSMISMLVSKILYKDEIEIRCEGHDEEEAMEKISELFINMKG